MRDPADTETSPDLGRRLAPGSVLANRYRIERQLGLGGMGVVYRAHDQELGVDVAVKVLRPDLGAGGDWTERFRRELVLAREVTHKNVVRIHDLGESDGLRFLTMRLVDGASLLEVLATLPRLPAGRALGIFRQVAEAVEQAHLAGIVHRDLKPGNILLAPDDTAYVTDFGVAHHQDRDHLTEAGAVVGTLDYLSPEQAAGKPVDCRSDIYALGILLFEMLTGQLPFRADCRAGALALRLVGRARDVSETGVRVPAHVRRLLRRCLERKPDRRYQSVRALLTDLDAGRAGIRDRVTRRGARLLAAVLAVALAGLAYRQWPATTSSHPPAPPAAAVAARTGVAVLPMADETGDPGLGWTANGIAEMLTSHLAEKPRIRVLDNARVLRMLRDLKLEERGKDEALLGRVAELLRVEHVVTGSLRRAGHRLRLDLRLATMNASGQVGFRSLDAETAAPEGLFRLVAGLGDRLGAELGSPGAPGGPSQEPATESLEAAKAYREGREHLSRGDSLAAVPALERAVREDPGFAAALEALSEAQQALGYHDKALSAAERAATALGSAETRLAWRVRARLALLRGEPAAAERAYQELVRRHPSDTGALLDLAAAQADQGAVERAVATLVRVTELDATDARAWLLLGKCMIRMGDSRKAVSDPLVRALALMTQLGNEQGQGDVLNAMGVAHQRLGDYPRAIAKYGEAAAIRARVGDKGGSAMSLKNRAGIYLAMGRFADAAPDLQEALRAFREIGDRKGQAEVWTEVGALHEFRGEYAEARKSYQEALRFRRELGDEQQLGKSYDDLGYVYFLEGEHDSALVYWRQALDLRRRLGDRAGVVLSTQNMGFLQTAQGRWSEAMGSFLDALQQAREIGFTNALAVSHGNIGLLHQYEGRYVAALASYDEALRILEELGDKRGLTEFTLKEAHLLLEVGRLEGARAKLDAADAWLRETGNLEQASDLHAALAEHHLRAGRTDAARAPFAEAVKAAVASPSRAAKLRARIAQGVFLLGRGDALARDLAPLVREADALGDVLLQVRAAEALARAELARGRHREAEALARRALRLAQGCGWEAGLGGLHALLGHVLQAGGDAAGGEAQLQESARRTARLAEALRREGRDSFAPAGPTRIEEAGAAPLLTMAHR